MMKRLQSLLLATSLVGQVSAQEQPTPLVGGLESKDSSIQFLFTPPGSRIHGAAVQQLANPVLTRTVSTTYGGWMTGRIPGVTTNQSSGQPGGDDVSVFLRGRSPIILVDGTPQSFPSINPEQIESITVLKDAVSTALLGMRGGNGAVLITTKKGSRNSGQQLEFMAQYGMQMPTVLPKFVNGADYARLYNEALVNDGGSPLYTEADIQAFASGSDPLKRPNVDWQKELLKDRAPMSRYDLGISGGNASTRYFINLDYLNQQGLFKEQSFNAYKTNANYARYIVRSNLESDLTRSLTATLNIFGRIQNSNQPGVGAATIFNNIRNTPAIAYPVINSDGSLAGNLNYQNNLYGQSVLSGYSQIYERDFKVDLALKLKLDKVLNGLWVRGLAALNAYHMEVLNRSKTFAVFREGTDAVGGKIFTRYGTTGDQQNSVSVNSQNRLMYSELTAGYDKTMGGNHLSIQALFNNDYRMVNSDLPLNVKGGGLQASYDLQRKYKLTLAAGYNGTERLPSSNRYGLFPAAGLEWTVSSENFMQKTKPWLSNLQVRLSAGRSGLANVGYYDYIQYYTTGSGYGFGSTIPSSTTTLQMGTLANPNIGWEKADKLNAGINASFFNNRLELSFDYFRNKYFDLVMSKIGSDIFGTDYMRDNLGSYAYRGTEIYAKWQSKPGKVQFYVSPNISFVRTEVLDITEPNQLYAYQYLRGNQIGQPYGYVADGLFTSAQQIAGSAVQGTNIQPGDIRYKDLNGDGRIDAADQTVIGNMKTPFNYGVDAGLNVMGFELSVLLQGASNVNYSLSSIRAFQNNGNAQIYQWQADGRFTSGSTSATYPRLYLGNNSNNSQFSSYWITKGDYMRLKNLQLAYTIPQSVSRKASIRMARVFVSGTNLLTASSLNDYNIDPEAGSGYPIMKTVMAGINLNF